ncbi:glycoside hydrolase family 5 protein [Acidovorax sp. Leaf78]|uniref:glycoside hydrolase family 5 protein n=1 Tax=Acidovorax sp. Leaf78 TaxID=1736237 RepID=UPI00138F856B|nr:cellulase family glycosylhydrolase [Acidovorax sp. Leaf78]
MKMRCGTGSCLAAVGLWLALLWGGASAQAQALPSPPSTPLTSSPLLGAASGASRQAWAAAAGLSRGIGLVAALEPSTPLSEGREIADTLAQAGFRSVRLTVPQASLRALAGLQNREQAARLKELDAMVDALLARGLSVVLALRNEPGHGAAASTVQDKGGSAGPARHREAMVIWQHLAQRYATRPQRLLFEVSLVPGGTGAVKNQRMSSLLKAIRQSDATRVVVVGWSEAVGVSELRVPADRHLIVGITHAEPFRFIRQGAPGVSGSDLWRGSTCCSPQEKQLMALPLDIVHAWSLEHRYPVWVQEFSSYQDIPAELRARHARLVRQAAEERGLPWAYGDWSGEFGVYDPVRREWEPSMLRALTGP